MTNNIDNDPDAQALARLEQQVVAGQKALARRNALLADLSQRGWRQVEMTRVLNSVRERSGADPLTPDAVFAALRRHRSPQSLTS